jgi:glycosyltransferase involved in cell wall biosynthesis
MHKMRVLHVITGLGTGGAEALLFRLVTRRASFEHEVVALAGRDWYSPLLEQHGVKVHHLNISSFGSSIAAVGKLNHLIGTTRPDVIQTWMYGPNLLAGLVALPHRIPVVWGIHTSTIDGLGFASRFSARCGGILSPLLAASIINCSTRSAGIHVPWGYRRGSTTVIHNGYDPDMFFPDEKLRLDARRALGFDRRTFVLGTIARWHPKKDLPNLVNALAILKRKGIPFRCLLVGRNLDSQNADLLESLQLANCESDVLALGERADIQNLSRVIDLHVLPSCGGEAFPNVVAETMLSGTPNVVTDVGDAALMVGGTGWVVEPKNPAALAATVQSAYQEFESRPDEWERRRIAARKQIADQFTFDLMASAYEEIWHQRSRSSTT